MALAIFARCDVGSKLVHFDYNCILYDHNPEWANIHDAWLPTRRGCRRSCHTAIENFISRCRSLG